MQASQFGEAIELAQAFAKLIQQLQPEQFEDWLEQALNSKIAAFVNFAASLKEGVSDFVLRPFFLILAHLATLIEKVARSQVF